MSRIGQAIFRSAESIEPTGADAAPTLDVVETIQRLADDAHGVSPWAFDQASLSAEPPARFAPAASAVDEPTPARVEPPAPSIAPDEKSGLLRPANPLVDERLVVTESVPQDAVEQYRRCGATLHHAQLERGVRVVMVTSAALGEGKSLTSANIALTLSVSYRRRVLLIDADLRRPALHDIFQVSNRQGLSNGLRRESAATFPTVALTDTLALLPAGVPDPDPMASLTSARMRQLIDEARGKFDWVVIDTPPVALMPDASLLADMADGVVLVVQAGGTPLDIIKQATKAIGKKRILGVVLNRAEGDRISGYAGY